MIFSSSPNSPSAAEIGTHLTLFERVRKDRASTMQIYSSAGQDEAAKIQAAAREYVKNGKIPSKSHPLYSSKRSFCDAIERFYLIDLQ